MPACSAHLFPNAGYIEKDHRAHGSPRPPGTLARHLAFSALPGQFHLAFKPASLDWNCMLHRLGSAAFLVFALCSSYASGQGSVGSRHHSLPINSTPVPTCNAGQEGVTACLAGRQCVCYFERGGTMTGRRDGYRWNCGLLLPSCVEAPVETAQPSRPIPILPPAITLEPGGVEVAPGRNGLGERSWR
jgi:hypothetical protein